MYKFKAFNIFNKIGKSYNYTIKNHHLNVSNRFIEQNLSIENKVYQASQAIYTENIEPDIKYLAKSLIYIDDCRKHRLTSNKKLKKMDIHI